MLEDRSTIYAKVAPERIADVNWIMEGYEHLALVSTIDHQEGIILLRGTPDTYNDVLEIVENTWSRLYRTDPRILIPLCLFQKRRIGKRMGALLCWGGRSCCN